MGTQKVMKRESSFNGLLNRLDTVEERPPELETVSIETSKIEKQREDRLKNPHYEYPGTVGQL